MGLQLIQAPGVEPVTVEDAIEYLREYADAPAAQIALLIGAARRFAEQKCNASFITQKWRLTIDAFPGRYSQGHSPAGQIYGIPPNCLLLERGPVQSIESIVYTDMAGATQTITSPAAPDYAIDLSGGIGRMTPGFGRIWPITLPQIGAAQINFTAGYGADGSAVPEGIRHWILMRVATLYENREESMVAKGGVITPLPHVDSLLEPYTNWLA